MGVDEKLRTVDIKVDPSHADDAEHLRELVARRLRRSPDDVGPMYVARRSIDARGGKVQFQLRVVLGESRPIDELGLPDPRPVDGGRRVIVVGAGPAGLFAAYELARHGIASTVVDRGKRVQPRRRDLALLNRGEAVDDDSNYCFGEGGAGTYSDGKLYTRADKRGDVRDVLEVLVRHGATPEILVDARPHIGSNRLPKVIGALRDHLLDSGVTFEFGAKVVDLVVSERGTRRARGVRLADGRELLGDAVVMATGHSARDVFDMLATHGAELECKPFAVGVRIEHPQPLIDRAQYGRFAGHPNLPAAYYRLAETVSDRGVFSFCMCPGGWIVPAMTTSDELVVNGMSLSKRNSPFANSGLVVGIEPADVRAAGFDGPLGGVELQRRIEARAMELGGGRLRAPAALARDFLLGKRSDAARDTSYLPGLTPARLDEALDAGGVPVSGRLRDALRAFDARIPGYAGVEAQLVGVETRTSSPVRVVRDPRSLVCRGIEGLFPAAEGAGYAGGIVSAAMDGQRIARRLVESFT
jgi:uncharacterized protein